MHQKRNGFESNKWSIILNLPVDVAHCAVESCNPTPGPVPEANSSGTQSMREHVAMSIMRAFLWNNYN